MNAILCGTLSIRDVIAFPKTAKGTCLMTASPGAVEPKQLRDLYLEMKLGKPPGPGHGQPQAKPDAGGEKPAAK